MKQALLAVALLATTAQASTPFDLDVYRTAGDWRFWDKLNENQVVPALTLDTKYGDTGFSYFCNADYEWWVITMDRTSTPMFFDGNNKIKIRAQVDDDKVYMASGQTMTETNEFYIKYSESVPFMEALKNGKFVNFELIKKDNSTMYRKFSLNGYDETVNTVNQVCLDLTSDGFVAPTTKSEYNKLVESEGFTY